MLTHQPTAAEIHAGQAVYSRFVLAIYDPLVLGFSNRYVWRCPSDRMLARYDELAGPRHLDVGVGTGWYLDRCSWHGRRPEITLLDLNNASLRAAASRVRRYNPRTIRANVLDPVDLGDDRFDSIAINYLLHCLPGRIETKAATLIRHLRPYLAPGGALFGSTILGRGVEHNAVGRRLMREYNRKKRFSNEADDLEGLRRAISSEWGAAEIEMVGTVALFAVRGVRA
jgi:hypothetical protein